MNACSTARGDSVCLGCGRAKEDVDNWIYYSDEKKIRISIENETKIIAMRSFPT